MYTINAKTCNLPCIEFSMRVDTVTHAFTIADILRDAFHSVDVIESEITGEIISSTYTSDTHFEPINTPETAIQFAILYYKNNC